MIVTRLRAPNSICLWSKKQLSKHGFRVVNLTATNTRAGPKHFLFCFICVSVLGRPWHSAWGVMCGFPCRTSETNNLATLCVYICVCACKLDWKSPTDSAIFVKQFFPPATLHQSGQPPILPLMIEIAKVINRLHILHQIRRAVLAHSRYRN